MFPLRAVHAEQHPHRSRRSQATRFFQVFENLNLFRSAKKCPTLNPSNYSPNKRGCSSNWGYNWARHNFFTHHDLACCNQSFNSISARGKNHGTKVQIRIHNKMNATLTYVSMRPTRWMRDVSTIVLSSYENLVVRHSGSIHSCLCSCNVSPPGKPLPATFSLHNKVRHVIRTSYGLKQLLS